MVMIDITEEVRALSKKNFICVECDMWTPRDEMVNKSGFCLGCYEALRGFCTLCKKYVLSDEERMLPNERQKMREHLTQDLKNGGFL